MHPVDDLLSDEGSVPSSAIVDDEIDLSLVFYGFVLEFGVS